MMPSTLAWITRSPRKVRPADSLPHLLQRLVVGRLARLDDQVAHAELLDERHDLLLRAGADRQHRDHRRHAEDHPQHRQQRSQLVRAQVVEPEPQLGQEVRRRARDAVATMLIAAAPPPARRRVPLEVGRAAVGSTSATSVPSAGRRSRRGSRSVLNLDLALLEPVADLHVDVRLAVLLEHGLSRHVERVGISFPSIVKRADEPAFSRSGLVFRTGTSRRTGA